MLSRSDDDMRHHDHQAALAALAALDQAVKDVRAQIEETNP